MAWYYHQNGINQGPVQVSDLQSLVESRAVSPDTLVWTEGLENWVPYHSSAAVPSTFSGTAAGITHVCAECNKSFREEDMLQYENSWVCASCKPIFFQRVKEGVVPVGQLNYARIGSRFAAVFIDGIIIIVVTVIPEIMLYSSGKRACSGLDYHCQRAAQLCFPHIFRNLFHRKIWGDSRQNAYEGQGRYARRRARFLRAGLGAPFCQIS
jgi:hypothetical protein